MILEYRRFFVDCCRGNVVEHDAARWLPGHALDILDCHFFFAAFVINPRRKECPAKAPATPADVARRRSIRATSPESSRVAVSRPRKSNVRKTAAAGPTIASQRSSAATAQSSLSVDVGGSRGTKSSRPFFHGSFFARDPDVASRFREPQLLNVERYQLAPPKTPLHSRAATAPDHAARVGRPASPSGSPAAARSGAAPSSARPCRERGCSDGGAGARASAPWCLELGRGRATPLNFVGCR